MLRYSETIYGKWYNYDNGSNKRYTLARKQRFQFPLMFWMLINPFNRKTSYKIKENFQLDPNMKKKEWRIFKIIGFKQLMIFHYVSSTFDSVSLCIVVHLCIDAVAVTVVNIRLDGRQTESALANKRDTRFIECTCISLLRDCFFIILYFFLS